jgi:hypothetical protein
VLHIGPSMETIDSTKQTLSNLGAAAIHLRRVIPRELVVMTFGVFGAGLAFGMFIGALSYRALRRSSDTSEANYEAWSKTRLYDLASQQDIPGRESMSKDELIEAIRSAA